MAIWTLDLERIKAFDDMTVFRMIMGLIAKPPEILELVVIACETGLYNLQRDAPTRVERGLSGLAQ